MKSNFNILGMGDTHCGSLIGLTPPAWRTPEAIDARAAAFQRESWAWFSKVVAPYRGIDVLIANGDMIDGCGDRSGGTEEITTDRNKQAKMAAEILDLIAPKAIVATYGTGYHTGQAEDFEDHIFPQMRHRPKLCVMESEAFFEHEGVVFDVRHHIGTSSVAHGRATALLKEHVWNALLAEIGKSHRAQVIMRNHAHYFMQVFDGYRLGLILPALQGRGTKYGSRRCGGDTAFGIVPIECRRGEVVTWRAHLLNAASQRPQLHHV